MPESNELRLFISSTFRDMHEEREHLVKKVFPEIRALCRRRGVTFTDVDLRWGLTEEEASLGRVIRTCLEEVDKCRPWFIGMIGNRYGWVPELHDVLMDPDLLTTYPFVEEMAIDGTSVTEMEFIHGVFDAPQVDGEHAFFYHRTGDLADADDPERLGALIERTRATDRPYREFGDVEELGNAVRDDLLAIIEKTWPAEEAPTELDLERRAHAAFAASRTRAYIPNPLYLKEFSTWLAEGKTPLVITGESGLGKSSLVAYLTEYFQKKNRDAFIVAHYVGASASSGTALSVMRHVISAICRRFGIDEDIPSNPEELQRRFANWLYRCERLAGEEGIDVLIVIDAVNQLDTAGERMTWLPETIPQQVRMVLSTTPGTAHDRLVDREWSELTVAPLDDERIRRSIVVRYLGEFHKGVSPDQLRRVVGDEKARSPLYLRVVAEELRLHGEHETVDDVIDRYRGTDDLLYVFDLLLERTERDYGEPVVGDLLRLVASSRSGLSEEDLLDLIGFSRLDLSRLLFAFDYHLIRRDGLLSFFHDYLRRAVERRYLGSRQVRREHHRRLADYFSTREISRRSASERLWGYAQAEDDEKVVETLVDPDAFGMLYTGAGQQDVLSHWSRLQQKGYRPEDLYVARVDDESSDTSAWMEFATLAGDLLERLSHWPGAITIHRRVLSRALEEERGSDAANARRSLGNLFRLQGSYPEALQHLTDALAWYETSGDPSGQSYTLGFIGMVYRMQGEHDRALEFYEKKLSVCEELGTPAGMAIAFGIMGNLYGARGDHDRALELHQQAHRLFEQLGDRKGAATASGSMAKIHAHYGDLDRALEALQEYVAICEELGDRKGIATGIGNMGLLYQDREEPDRAMEFFQRQLTIYEELGDRNGIGLAVGNIGSLCSDRGESDRALALFRRKLAISRELGDREETATALGTIGLESLVLGEDGEALASLWQAAEECRAIGLRWLLPFWSTGIARLLLRLAERGDTMPAFLPEHLPDATPQTWHEVALQSARHHAEESIAAAEASSNEQLRRRAEITLARIDVADGKGEAAEQHLRQLIEQHGDRVDEGAMHYWKA